MKKSAYLFSVVLNWHTKDTLCPIACNLVNFSIEPRILGRKKEIQFIGLPVPRLI